MNEILAEKYVCFDMFGYWNNNISDNMEYFDCNFENLPFD